MWKKGFGEKNGQKKIATIHKIRGNKCILEVNVYEYCAHNYEPYKFLVIRQTCNENISLINNRAVILTLFFLSLFKYSLNLKFVITKTY